jgi:tRNA nucleotidyltransferase/poly(A) polymerase
MDMAQRKYNEALEVIGLLEGAGFEARMAGGCVRDRLIGAEPQDYDVATNAAPDQVAKVAEHARIKVVPTGFEHGTMTLVMPSGPVEVTTLRIDLETYGRHATVSLGTDFKGDAARRDFTMNAMFEDRNGVIHDYFGGQDDLRKRTLRFVGDPVTRIQEDYLRIMRLFRFWARFDFDPAPGTLEAVQATKDGLLQISQERITYELRRIFTCPVLHKILAAMNLTGVLPVILPELGPGGFTLPDNRVLKELAAVGAASERFICALALLGAGNNIDSPDQMKDLGTRLRLSRAEIRKACLLITLERNLPAPDAPQSKVMALLDHSDDIFALPDSWSRVVKGYLKTLAVWRGGAAEKSMLAALSRIDVIEAKKSHLRKAELAVSVPEIMQMFQLKPGPEIGALVEDFRSAFRNEEWFSKPDGLVWLKKHVEKLHLEKKKT